MSQSWVFRKDDYDKILHKIKVLSERVEELEKKQGKAVGHAEPAKALDSAVAK